MIEQKKAIRFKKPVITEIRYGYITKSIKLKQKELKRLTALKNKNEKYI